MKKKQQKNEKKQSIAGTVKYRSHAPVCVFTGISAAVIFCTMMLFLLLEGTSLLALRGFWIWFLVMLLLLLFFWRYYRFAILFSEKQRAFIVNTMLTHRSYLTDEISSIRILEIRCKLPARSGYTLDGSPAQSSPLGRRSVLSIWTAKDVQWNYLIVQIGKRKLRVALHNEQAEQFCWFLHRTTEKEIWLEPLYHRIWTIDDLFVSSKDDPWEIERKEQKRKKKAE